MHTLQLFSSVGEIKMSYIRHHELPSQKILSSRNLYEVATHLFDPETIEYRESFWMICLNQGNFVIATYHVGDGGITGTVADVRMIFQAALKSHAVSIAVFHNHPSGQIRPSHNDVQITHKLRDAGKLLDISLLDHLIVTKERYYSFADEGEL